MSVLVSELAMEAQINVLGSMLIDSEVVGPLLHQLTAEDFIEGRYRNIFLAVKRLQSQGKEPDPLLVNDALGGNYREILDCTTDFLMGLADDFRPPAAPEPPAQEEPAQNVSNLDTFPEEEQGEGLEDEAEEPEEEAEEPPVRRVRWESRGCTPPEGKPVLTYALNNDGPVYRAVMWKDGQFKFPNGKKFATGLQYIQWLEIPLPSSGEEFQLERAEGQLVLSGWMPGGTFPRQPCEAVADFRSAGEAGRPGARIRRACWFDGEAFLFKRHGAKIDAECVRWMALPPVEDDVSKLDTNGGERV